MPEASIFTVSRGRSEEHILSIAKGFANRGGALLDCGCGQGEFLRALKEQGFSQRLVGLDGFDYKDQSKQSQPYEFIQHDFAKALPFADETFTTVVATEVLHYLENPHFLIREMARVCQKGGTIILSIPNNESIRALCSFFFRGYFPEYSAAYYPSHLTPLHNVDIERALNRYDFQNIRLHWTNLGRLPKLNLRWQALAPWLKGKRFSDNTIFTAIKKSEC